jgi:hypothetical protein
MSHQCVDVKGKRTLMGYLCRVLSIAPALSVLPSLDGTMVHLEQQHNYTQATANQKENIKK